MPNVAEKLKSGALVLHACGITQPRREAASILALALEKDKTFLVAHAEYELSKKEEKHFDDFLMRRARREPFQYIAGKQEFYGLDFEVNRDVLIPRPETELIVETAVEILKTRKNAFICEIGTGSGCISIAILHELEKVSAIGLDISPKALKVAARNAKYHQVAERLRLALSDVFARLKTEKFDLIVSNPPYIPLEQIPSLQPEVRDFEPLPALTDGKNGLSIIERIALDAPKFLKPNGILLMEIGYTQAQQVSRLFSPEIWQQFEILPDLQGIPRMVKAKKGSG